ncbi:hypothetical protein N7475_001108 [Penicillium sp. IBT 31633x]|nr:hypothetical protein N7475_001108 [Penicillium sp. IBT 31633x]
MSPSEHYQNLESLFHQAHQQFTATARSMIHMFEHEVLGLDSCQEMQNLLDLAIALLNEMEELGLAMMMENPYTEQYSVSDVPKLQCLHMRAALDEIRAGLAQYI